MSTSDPILIYGANGFTGRLVCERASALGMPAIAAGRNETAVRDIAERLGMPHRALSLDDRDALDRGLADVAAVVHCAGPYSRTSKPMVDACLRAGVHYMDITGELRVIESVLARTDEARRANVVLMPSVGFDVVPTDCMAKSLAEALPRATSLELAFGGGAFVPSPGTAATSIEGLADATLARRDGELVSLSAPATRDVPFAEGQRTRTCMSLPWGDLASAYATTGIPNITVYAVFPKPVVAGAKLLPALSPILRSGPVQGLLKRAAKRASGPSEEQRTSGRMWIWGRVEDGEGHWVEGHLEVPDGYELTVTASLTIASRILSGKVSAGATTPASALGARFVTELPGVGELTLLRG